MALSRRVVAEALGTAFLLAAVVGSGIMGEKLAGGNIAIADVPGFIVVQFLGAAAATVLFRWLVPSLPVEAKEAVVPRAQVGSR